MCCEHGDRETHLPPLVAQMLQEYRQLHREQPGFDWGDELVVDPPAARLPDSKQMYGSARLVPLLRLRDAFVGLAREGRQSTWPLALRRAVDSGLPPGLAVVDVTTTGLRVRGPSPGWLLQGHHRDQSVLLVNETEAPVDVIVAGHEARLASGEARVLGVGVHADEPTSLVTAGGSVAVITWGVPANAAELVVRAAAPSRWGIVDAAGYGWWAPGALEKWDVHDRPFFHAQEAVVLVPSGVPLTVSVARGTEFERREVTVQVADRQLLELEPARSYDAAAAGWYGADLHVHVNYSGDVVATPDDAAAMQAGEDLHLMNLVAGNMHTARIYDREALESWIGRDLPWSAGDRVARYGVEYRNDLLGHVHALGLQSAPDQYQSGHPRSDHPADWPPNSVACADLRERGGTLGYTHPVVAALGDGDSSPVFVSPRSVEARELPVDAALGLVDSMDLLGPATCSPEGAAHLYHRLLNCGLRLAPTAGTDVFLSFLHCTSLSNPPGASRVYADLRGGRLSVPAWQEALRAGRTFVTNGPWLELDVSGHAPGDVLDVSRGAVLELRARSCGPGVDVVSIIGADGELAAGDADVRTSVTVNEPGWFAAVARGGAHPAVLAPQVFAHTAPVHVEIDGRRIGRRADAAWCLDWIDRVEALAREHGRFDDRRQLDDLVAVLDQARSVYRAI